MKSRCTYTLPVSLAVIQSAAGPEWLVVVLSPANEGHSGPEGSKQPYEYSQGDGAAPLELCSCNKDRVQTFGQDCFKPPKHKCLTLNHVKAALIANV